MLRRTAALGIAFCLATSTACTTETTPAPPTSNTATDGQVLTLEGPGWFADFVVWSPDGTRIASSVGAAGTQVWDTATGSPLLLVDGNSPSWFPDGTRLVTSAESRVWIRDAASGEAIQTFSIVLLPVETLPSPDGTMRAITEGTPDRPETRIWDADTGGAIRTIGQVWVQSWSPDGTRLLSAEFPDAQVWDAATGRVVATVRDAWDYAVTWSPDGTRIAAASSDNTAGVWDAATGALLGTFTGHTDSVHAVAWSPDGSRIATAAYQSDEVRIWDVITGELLRTLTGPERYSASLRWSPDGTHLAAWDGNDMNTSASVWNAVTGERLDELTARGTNIYDLAWSPEGGRIATGHDDGRARIWTVGAST